MVKITLGVPVYNSEKFIRQALDSFTRQTMSKDEFEVMIVDDCSTDNTIDVISEYKDKINLELIKLPENSGGPGKPRNKIIEMANGEYIFFVDSDDYISDEALSNMYDFARKNNTDVLLAKMKGVNGRGVPQSMFKTTEDNVDLFESRLVYALGPTKMFKTRMLRENLVHFPENLKTAEDQIFTMKAYLKSNVISVLSDKDYYFATLREGEHMNSASINPKDFFKIMSGIVNMIFDSKESVERKNHLAASFIDRHFSFSRTKDFSIKIKDINIRTEFFQELEGFINSHLPKDVDEQIAPEIRTKVFLARNKDLDAYTKFEQCLKDKNFKITISNGRLFGEFDCLDRYPELKRIDVTRLNKMDLFMEKFIFDSKRLVLTTRINLALPINLKQDIVNLVLVHRVEKEEKVVVPVISHLSKGRYTFEIPIAGLICDNTDLGIWDAFIELRIGSYVVRGRLGNKRNKYLYRAETSNIISEGSLKYRLTPYFTKPYDNLSIYTRELKQALEEKVVFKYSSDTKQLIFKYPKYNLNLTKNTEFIFDLHSNKIVLNPSKILWTDKGTEVIFEGQDILNSKELKKLRFKKVTTMGLNIDF